MGPTKVGSVQPTILILRKTKLFKNLHDTELHELFIIYKICQIAYSYGFEPQTPAPDHL